MASIVIAASMQRTCSSHQVKRKQRPQPKQHMLSIETKKPNNKNVVTLNIEGQNGSYLAEQAEINSASHIRRNENGDDVIETSLRFLDERWKNGTWDLNMFVKHGKIDWDGVIVAGRAAMMGFFMAYLVDVLTRLDMVGQVGNFVCKAGVFVTVVGVILLRRTQDFDNLRKLADEATFYDKQWQSSWQQDHNANIGTQGKKK